MKGYWIRPDKTFQKNTAYRFEKMLNVSKDAEIELNISADTRYKFSFNGEYVCEGPCIGDMWTRKYETVKIPRELVKDGENLISVTVAHYVDRAYDSCIKGKYPALLVFGTVKDGERCEEIATSEDAGWKCYYEPSKGFFERTGVCMGLPHSESVSLDEDIETGVVNLHPNHIEKGNFTPYGVPSGYVIEKRTIPLMEIYPAVGFSEVRRGEDFCEIDAGVYTTAYPRFTFKGEKGGEIRFIYAECYSDPENFRVKGRRDCYEEGKIISGYSDTVTLSGETQSFEPFTWRSYRFIRVEFPKGTEFDIKEQTYRPFFYPIEEKSYFKTSSEIANKLWEISINTVKCCTHETFVDCPYYEQQQYCMDSALEMMFMFRFTDDFSMGRKSVYDLAYSVQPDGMICAHYPDNQPQVIPTFSLFWILMLRDYVTYSGDMKAAKELMPVVDRVLTGFDNILTPEGLVNVTKYWHYTDWVLGWEGGIPPMGNKKPLTVSSMMYAAALETAASLAKDIGRCGLAEEYLARKAEMIEAINKHCYDEKEQFYVDVPGYNTYSEHTAVWAVLCGAVTGEEAVELMERSFAKDVSRASFSFNYYMFRALEKTGLYKKYSPKTFEGWYEMYENGCTVWCEKPNNCRSECHGWSSAPLYEYSAMVMGVQPTSNGFKTVMIKPELSEFDKLDGAVPTPLGDIKIRWENKNGVSEFETELPKGVTATVVLPDGYTENNVTDSFKKRIIL